MDLHSFYAQSGQFECFELMHAMLLDEPDSARLREATTREKLARIEANGKMEKIVCRKTVTKSTDFGRLDKWRKSDTLIARLEKERRIYAGEVTNLLKSKDHQQDLACETLANDQKWRKCLAKWRADFDTFIWRHYHSKSRHRTLIKRHTLEHILRQLKMAKLKQKKLSAGRRRLCERYVLEAIGGEELLLQRNSKRVFVPVEEIFDNLQRFHAERGHSSYRVSLYVDAKAKFANIGREILCEYMNGFEQFLLEVEAENGEAF